MFWQKSVWPNVKQGIILLAKFMLDKNILDKPILYKMILDAVLFPVLISHTPIYNAMFQNSKLLSECG